MRGTRALAVAVVLALISAPAAFGQTVPAYDAGLHPAEQQTPPNSENPSGPSTLPILDWAVGLGYEHTDNVNRSTINRTSQDILQPTLNFTYNQQGSTLQAQVTGVIQYIDYLQNFYGNEFRGQLAGTVNWVISPQRLNFVAQDYSSVEPVSIRASNAPSNQQQVNVLVAGPTLSFRMGNALRGEADLRYIDTAASKTKDFDSQRAMGAFRATRDLSANDTLSFNAEAVHVNFNNVNPIVNPSRYDQYNGFIQYQSHLQQVDVDLAAGASRIEFSQGAGTHSGSLLRANVGWHLSPRNALQISASNQLADSTTDLIQSPALIGPDVTDLSVQIGRTAISPVVYRDQGASLNYQFSGQRIGFTLTPYYTRLRQLNGNDLSRDGYGAVAGITYLINPLMTLGFTAANQTTRYISDHSHDRDSAYSVDLVNQFSPHWSWRVALTHTGRTSTRPGFDYTENQLFFILYYHR